MKIYSPRRSKPKRSVGKRTYQVVVVPFDIGRNGEAKKIEVQVWIDNSEPELNYDLMWTWFLPNPLWPPKNRK